MDVSTRSDSVLTLFCGCLRLLHTTETFLKICILTVLVCTSAPLLHFKTKHYQSSPLYVLTFPIRTTCFLLILSITNRMQSYTIFFITVNSLHVSGGFSAHHQELKNCTHSIGYMLSLLAATASVGESEKESLTYTRCCVYSF